MQKTIVIRNSNVRVTDILEMIARGNSYSQILKELPELTIADIMSSAQFGKEVIDSITVEGTDIRLESELKLTASNGKIVNLTELRKKYPRAYEKWDGAEDDNLRSLFEQGKKTNELAELLMRQPGAIISRLKTLGLFKDIQVV